MIDGLLVVLLLASVYTDVRYRWIPNWQTVPAFGLGIVLNGLHSGPGGLLSSLGGGLLGLAILMVPYMLGYIGGGDVKLQMAVGALVGWPFIFWALWCGAVAGGVLAIVIVARRRSIMRLVRYILYLFVDRLVWPLAALHLPASWRVKLAAYDAEKPAALSAKLPYGLAIALGVVLAAYIHHWQSP
ncbi:MAG: A24 family peptidase [Bacteroidetes bacterium]|nr:A24 family peptidase [Bacteroidota bacterium]MCL5026979.1 A24 family peptidase [Chloroflexota bacterium]